MSIALRFLPAACMAGILATALPARAAAGPAGIVAALQKKYAVTEMAPDRQQVAVEGAIMSLRAGGVYTEPGTTFAPDNKVVDGKVQAGAMAKLFYTKTTHILQSGAKVYLTKIETKAEPKDDMLRLTIVTVDTFPVPGKDDPEKFAASLSFHFKKGYLDEAPPEDVEQEVDAVLGPDTAPPAQTQAAAPAPAPPQATPPAPIAPAGPPPTITIGESSTQVLQAMGMPLQMIDLGKKKTYVYKSMKIVFVEDKVSDVQ